MPPLPAIMYNSELTVPADVHLLCRSVCFLQTPDNNNVLYLTEKVTQMVGCLAWFLAVRAPYLVLSLLLILVCDPVLPVIAVRHFVWAHKLDMAKVFSSLGDDARHLSWHKQIHLKKAQKTKQLVMSNQIWNSSFENMDEVNKKMSTVIISHCLCQVNNTSYISFATRLRQFPIKPKSYILS